MYAAKKGTPATVTLGSGGKTAGGSQDNPFRLKPDARLKICLTCHADFEDKLKKPFIHTPIKRGGAWPVITPMLRDIPSNWRLILALSALPVIRQYCLKGRAAYIKLPSKESVSCVMTPIPRISSLIYVRMGTNCALPAIKTKRI